MFFGRPTQSSMPTTIGQGQYHNRTGLMSNKQPTIKASSTIIIIIRTTTKRRITASSGIEHHQRRPLSWFQ